MIPEVWTLGDEIDVLQELPQRKIISESRVFFKMVRVNIILEEEIHKKAKINSVIKETTLIEYVNKAIADKLKKEKWPE